MKTKLRQANAQAQAKVAWARARVCRGLATPLLTVPIRKSILCGENRKMSIYVIGASVSKPHATGTTLHSCVHVCLDQPLTVNRNFSISVEGTSGNKINATGT